MITFSNGYKMDFCCASGALGFDGDGYFWEQPFRWFGFLRPQDMTIVAKTVTLYPRVGNLKMWKPWECVKPIGSIGAGAFVNAVGLTNPGIKQWLQTSFPKIRKRGYSAAVSVGPETPQEAEQMGKMLKGLNIPFIELNCSCPNTDAIDDIVEIAKQLYAASHTPIVVKLSVDQVFDFLVEPLSKLSGVEAFHTINTIPWNKIYPNRRSPLKRPTGAAGGVSGPPIKEYALRAIKYIKGFNGLPVIGGGGISSLADVYEFEEAGAAAFSIGSLFIRRPWAPNQIIQQYREYQHDHQRN